MEYPYALYLYAQYNLYATQYNLISLLKIKMMFTHI